MSKKFSYRALIKALEKLYTKVSLHLLHKRINTYHSKASDGKNKHHDGIKTLLSTFIETTVAQATSSDHSNHNYDHLAEGHKPQPNHSGESQSGHLNRERIDELSKYFKARNKGDELHPAIQDKLKHSVWEHIHATVRCARQGDERNAKMHLNIASTACKELGHYMDDDEYQTFVSEAESHLDILTTNNKLT